MSAAPKAGFFAALVLALLPASVQAEPPALQTNQSYVEELARPTELDAGNLMSVFGYVMSQLPERVNVYPTENYYYFGFLHGCRVSARRVLPGERPSGGRDSDDRPKLPAPARRARAPVTVALSGSLDCNSFKPCGQLRPRASAPSATT